MTTNKLPLREELLLTLRQMHLKSPVTQDDLDDKKGIYAYTLDDEPTTVKLDINGYDDVAIFGASSVPLAEELRDYLNTFFSAIETLIAESREKKLREILSGRSPRGWAWYISRARAIAEHYLIDVSKRAFEAGIGCPVALTSTAWQDCVWVKGRDPAIEAQRLRHLLDSLRAAIPPLDGEWEHVNFPVEVADIRAGTTRVFGLDAFAGTGDDGEPVINLKRPCECYFWEEHLPLARRIHGALAANERPDDEGIVACLLETPEHHAALRHAVQVDGATVEHLAAALWCGHRLQTLISPTNSHRVVFRDMAENDSSC